MNYGNKYGPVGTFKIKTKVMIILNPRPPPCKGSTLPD